VHFRHDGAVAQRAAVSEWRRLYRGRSAAEREFGRLKHHYGLAMLRVHGVERVRRHADLIMFARLAEALARSRALRLAA
jgi:hypothetical protein